MIVKNCLFVFNLRVCLKLHSDHIQVFAEKGNLRLKYFRLGWVKKRSEDLK